jgi:transcriptional regulator with XRE-family HTH domain
MVRKSSASLLAILAENIKSFRKEKGCSQEELAEQCGLHRTYIGSVERHERNVTLSTLEALAETLGVTVPELLTKRAKLSNNLAVRGATEREKKREIGDIIVALRHLAPAQKELIKKTIFAFGGQRKYWRASDWR